MDMRAKPPFQKEEHGLKIVKRTKRMDQDRLKKEL
jgi:hypothetical protein